MRRKKRSFDEITNTQNQPNRVLVLTQNNNHFKQLTPRIIFL
jgi:hypothetical protein